MSDRSNVAQDAKAHLKDLGEAARERVTAEAHDRADVARRAAAEEVQSASDAASAAAGQFDSGSIQAQVAHQIADQIEGIAIHLRQSNYNDLAEQASDFARRNPLLFIGGAAALGFAASRFLKARDPHPETYSDDEDPWQSADNVPDDNQSSTPIHRTALAEINGSAGHG